MMKKKFTLKDFRNYTEFDLEDTEEMFKVKCKNCGKRFGAHHGMMCDDSKPSTMFNLLKKTE
jgi:hypothetical protein